VPLADLILKEEVYQIVGAAMDVYYQLGCGFLEPIYQEAFEIELGRRGIPYQPQCELTTYYKGQALTKVYRADVVCFEQIIAELKACDRLTGIDESQIINYLKVTRKHVGLLLNFGSRGKLEWKRYVL
jgi:GxxExxY protein